MKKRLFIFGTGSHARKVFHYARELGWNVAGFIDEALNAVAPVSGVSVLFVDKLPKPLEDDCIFVAIGNPEVRSRLITELSLTGWSVTTIIHPLSYVAPDAIIKEGVLIAAGAVVETRAVVGVGAIVDIGVLVDHDTIVKDFTHLRPGQVYI